MIISSIFKVLYFVLEAFALLKHLCLLPYALFQVLEEVLQAFNLSACPMPDRDHSFKNHSKTLMHTYISLKKYTCTYVRSYLRMYVCVDMYKCSKSNNVKTAHNYVVLYNM